VTPDDATISEDLLLGGRIRLRQPRGGYRAGLDAALLAVAAAPAPASTLPCSRWPPPRNRGGASSKPVAAPARC
jgi:hypothetical protein